MIFPQTQLQYLWIIRSYFVNSSATITGFCITMPLYVVVYLLYSCSSIIDPPDYSQPPGFGGTTQVSQSSSKAAWLIAFKFNKFFPLFVVGDEHRSLNIYTEYTDMTVNAYFIYFFARVKDRRGTTAPWRQEGRG